MICDNALIIIMHFSAQIKSDFAIYFEFLINFVKESEGSPDGACFERHILSNGENSVDISRKIWYNK